MMSNLIKSLSGGLGFQVQLVGILGSLLLLGIIISLVRNRRLREEHSLLWILTGIVLFLLSLVRPLLDVLSHWMGIYYPPAALFLIGFGFTLLILMYFSVLVSDLTDRNKRLAQEIALLKQKLEVLQKKVS
jgi:hypothetical protein